MKWNESYFESFIRMVDQAWEVIKGFNFPVVDDIVDFESFDGVHKFFISEQLFGFFLGHFFFVFDRSVCPHFGSGMIPWSIVTTETTSKIEWSKVEDDGENFITNHWIKYYEYISSSLSCCSGLQLISRRAKLHFK